MSRNSGQSMPRAGRGRGRAATVRTGMGTMPPDSIPVPLISADSHVNEPRDLWSSALPASMREQAMRGIAASDDGGWDLIFDGRQMAVDAESEADRVRGTEPEERFRVM